jgi:uncharacterized protein
VLLVKTKIAPSAIHGLGLFANQFIGKGQVIWRFSPGFDREVTFEELETLPIHLQEWTKHYGYLDFHLNRYILHIDDARFVNHSNNACIYVDYAQDSYGIDVADRDIAPGEELTYDYNQFDSDWLKGDKP